MSFASSKHADAAQAPTDGPRHVEHRRGRFARNIVATVPIVVIGSLAISFNLASPAQAAQPPRRIDRAKTGVDEASAAGGALAQGASAPVMQTASTTAAAPRTYTVVTGDTISEIAGRFGLSTASVLALNGLSWKTLIFPGQKLVLTELAAAPAQPPAPTPTLVKYVVIAGDTISGIAAAHGLSTETVLAANGLGWSSLIFAGQSITLPGGAQPVARPVAPAPAPTPAPAPAPAVGIVPMSEEMRQNAEIIVAAARKDGVSDYGIVIALAAAMQESGLINVNHGDKDSLGLFQQRPSAGWGSAAQIMNPTDAALAFFGGPNNPNAGRTRGLLDIPGWQAMTVTEAAQAVQISAYPDAYAKWEASARVWLSQIE